MSNVEAKHYYYIDVELKARQIIGWGSDPKQTMQVNLPQGYHRIFLSKGQFNKFVKSLSTM